LDVVVSVIPVRHIRGGQIGNLCERVVEFSREFLFFRFQLWNSGLEPRHLCHQHLRGGFFVALLRRADLLGSRVAPRQRRLELLDRGAPALVELNQPLRFGRKAAPAKATVELIGMLADPLYVVHGEFCPASWPGSSRPSTSSMQQGSKTWMPGSSPGMTNQSSINIRRSLRRLGLGACSGARLLRV